MGEGKKKAELMVPNEMPAMIDFIKTLEDKVQHIKDSNYVTPMVFKGKKLSEETNIAKLVQVMGMICLQQDNYNRGMKELGLTTAPAFTVESYAVSTWKKDIRLRIAIINNKETIDQIAKFRKDAKDLMTQEDKKAILQKEMDEFVKRSL